MENSYDEEGIAVDNEEATVKGAEPNAKEQNDATSGRPKENDKELSSQLEKKLKGPLPRYETDKLDIEREYDNDEDYKFPTEPPCSGETSESCWRFECDTVPLTTKLCSDGRPQKTASQEDSDVKDIAASIISAYGLTPSFTHAGSEINLLSAPKKDNAPPHLTPSQEFTRKNPPAYFGQSPLRIPHDQVLTAMNGFANMFLCHEICINDHFDLEKCLPDRDSFAYRVQSQARRAFWGKFEEIFRKGKPSHYIQAAKILGEVKEEVIGILLPQHRRIKEMIESTIDIPHIITQIDNRAFDPMDFQRYADFIIDTLGRLCAPARDPEVKALRELKTAGKIFKGIFDLIERMKLDMANFIIVQTRPLIIKDCVHYERTKFSEYLNFQYRLHDDGLRSTRLWLLRHQAENRETRIVIGKAFGELLNYNYANPWPETLTLDTARLKDMALQIQRLAIIGTAILQVSLVYQVLFGERFVHDLREKAKKHLKLIINTNDLKNADDRKDATLRIAEEMCVCINQVINEHQKREITENEKQRIRSCIVEISEPDHKVHGLMLKRIFEYVDEVVCARWAYPVAMPPGIAAIHHEVYGTMSQFYRLMNHSRRVYGPIYAGLVEGKILPPRFPHDLNGQRDPDFDKLLDELRKDFEEDENDARLRREDNRRVRDAQAQLPDGIN